MILTLFLILAELNCPVVTIQFSDIDPVAFQTIIDYVYADFDETAIKIAESAVLNTLYAGRCL